MKRIYLSIILALAATPALAQIATAVSGAQSGSQSGALSAGNVTGVETTTQTSVPVTFNSPAIPTRTEADIKTVPSLGGMGGWAYAAPAGPCLGPSETKQGGAQAAWLGFGAGGQYGQGQSNLDWGCVIARELTIASTVCAAGLKKACDDRDKLYEMMPGVSAVRAGSLPEYAKAQVVAMPAPAAAPAPRSAAPATTASVQQPTNCTSDQFISKRTGQPLCR
jgi:hypothetical protein